MIDRETQQSAEDSRHHVPGGSNHTDVQPRNCHQVACPATGVPLPLFPGDQVARTNRNRSQHSGAFGLDEDTLETLDDMNPEGVD